MIIYKSVDEMRCIMTNTTCNLCLDILQEIEDVERLETILAKCNIVYSESVKDVGPSMSVPDPSMSCLGPSIT